MLEIRRLRDRNEVIESNKIDTLVFNGRRDYSKPDEPDPLARPAHWYWGAYENGKMVSTMCEIAYVMRFDGHDAKMSGIGGVGTLAEARRGGKVRRIYEKLFTEAYDSGVVFSCLQPFSHAFYRQFGYEICSMRNRLKAPLTMFERRRFDGTFTQVFPGDDTSALRRVHSAYIANLNHGIRRDIWPDDIAWRIFTNNDPYNTGTLLYLWRDGRGEPRAYIKYQHERSRSERGADENVMIASEVAFTDREALHAVLAFTGTLSAQIHALEWQMPTFLDSTDFVDVPWNAEQKLIAREMTRIVNVKAALEMMRGPNAAAGYSGNGGGSGNMSGKDGGGGHALVIEAVDPLLPVNNARWLVEFAPADDCSDMAADIVGRGERAKNRVAATNREADIVCDMPALAQLVTGYRSLDSLLLSTRSRVEVRGGEKTLRAVFTERPQHLTEYF